MSTDYVLEHAWLKSGWEDEVCVRVAASGVVEKLEVGAKWGRTKVEGWVLPGFPNVHSHAFQWAMAGLSEYRTRERDSFWSWREQMYASLKGLDPDNYFHRARGLYRRMRQAGYTSVGEFHYVHHQEDGQPYSDLAAMGEAVVEAARAEGMPISLLPVLYQQGGFQGEPLVGAQRRFELSDDQFFEICQSLFSKYGTSDDVVIGMAFHSLRAVAANRLENIVDGFDSICGRGPIHIHVAEQIPEVEQCLAVTGRRPVELLYDSVNVDGRWCLVHATHLNDREQEMIAASGATVGICPVTEANLGDGIFPAERHFGRSGKWAIGSDSHIATDPFSELRMLEYGQRLFGHQRAVLSTPELSCGETLVAGAIENGSPVLGLPRSGIAESCPADWIVLDSKIIERGLTDPANSPPARSWTGRFSVNLDRFVKASLAAGTWVERDFDH